MDRYKHLHIQIKSGGEKKNNFQMQIESVAGFWKVYTRQIRMDKLYTPQLLGFIARGMMVIIVWNGHGDTSSNLGRDRLHFT